MKIPITRGTLTKEEQLELGRLLLKAGYEVSIRKSVGKGSKSVIFISFSGLIPDVEEEDLS